MMQRAINVEVEPVSAAHTAALKMASMGILVFPVFGIKNGRCTCYKGLACKHPGKHPLTLAGHLAATTSARIINIWFRNFKAINYGVRTGIAFQAPTRSWL